VLLHAVYLTPAINRRGVVVRCLDIGDMQLGCEFQRVGTVVAVGMRVRAARCAACPFPGPQQKTGQRRGHVVHGGYAESGHVSQRGNAAHDDDQVLLDAGHEIDDALEVLPRGAQGRRATRDLHQGNCRFGGRGAHRDQRCSQEEANADPAPQPHVELGDDEDGEEDEGEVGNAAEYWTWGDNGPLVTCLLACAR
jgi:hypothetical protein